MLVLDWRFARSRALLLLSIFLRFVAAPVPARGKAFRTRRRSFLLAGKPFHSQCSTRHRAAEDHPRNSAGADEITSPLRSSNHAAIATGAIGAASFARSWAAIAFAVRFADTPPRLPMIGPPDLRVRPRLYQACDVICLQMYAMAE